MARVLASLRVFPVEFEAKWSVISSSQTASAISVAEAPPAGVSIKVLEPESLVEPEVLLEKVWPDLTPVRATPEPIVIP